jgi:L-lactate utilization protein LutC
MNDARASFLATVRRAVADGNRIGGAPPLPKRGDVGYQGGGADPIARFRDEAVAAGARVQIVADRPAAVAKVVALCGEHGARRVLIGRGALVDSLALGERLLADGVEAISVDELDELDELGEKEAVFGADVGITGADALIAETGTVVQESRPCQPRSLSLLPPVHIVVADRTALVPDLFDLFADKTDLPSCLSLITGPSKTGDIEMRLVTGVHGPGEVHVVVIDGPTPSPPPAAPAASP